MQTSTPAPPFAAVHAQAELHHQYLIGLQLMIATREGPEVVGEWMFRLFRRKHEESFLSGLVKLGLDRLPHAVACARYHVLSNGIGGVGVDYMEESDTRAWVRFRYPRWMYDGPALCGVPIEASRGFLRGWYAQNGVTLGNPRLGFVCVSEDMSGQFGLCGYFREADQPLGEDERLVFSPRERPPAWDPDLQPRLAAGEWSEERLARAGRNYAMGYIRTGIAELAAVIGSERTRERAGLAARLIGLQHYSRMADRVGGIDGEQADAARFLARMFRGMGDEVTVTDNADGTISLDHGGLRILRGLAGSERDTLLACWIELWRGAIASHRTFMTLDVRDGGDRLTWTLRAE